ncbi:MAG: sulfurtransferase TusA family protein [Candidatus Riflebacteria bacterium]|nr:sulfurtransferase TusA family protein [Candidatus Riflebacteria bacterium]
MANKVLDAKGLKCPQPTLRLTATVAQLKPGDTIEVIADCPTFEVDVKGWCQRMKKVLISLKDEGGTAKRATIKV